MEHALLAAGGWILDVIFFVILLSSVFAGAGRGFIRSVSRLAGTLFAIAFAFLFAASFEVFLDDVFGMTTAIARGLSNSFADNELLALELSGTVNEETLAIAMPSFFAKIIANSLVGQTLPAGTTGAMLLGGVVAKWIAVVISFLLLIILIKLAVWLTSTLLSRTIEKIIFLRVVNRALGACFGFLSGGMCIFFLLSVCSWLPIPALHSFLSSSGVVGAIFSSAWFQSATSYVFSLQWLSSFVAGF